MRRALCLSLFLAAALCVAADTVVPRQGQPTEGKVVTDDGSEVVINPYFSKFKECVWRVVKLPKAAVAKVDVTPETPFREFWRRSAGIKAKDAPAWVELGKWAKEKKLEPEAKECAANALAADPENAEAKALLGAEADKLAKSSPRHNRELAARIADYAALDAGERKAAYDALKKDFGTTLPREWFDRVGRSMAQPKGFREEVKLTLNSEKTSGVYCIYVPDDYDPLRPWPLVIGLHGGGPAGKDGKGVVGSGPQFYPFLDTDVRARGYIAVCPTALAAPWAESLNDPLFTSVLQEVQILFNVDLNRVYLIGHSMGGFGTWHFGPKYAEKFACIAPASGGGHNGEGKLADLGTGVYVYHSDNDGRCRVEPDREAADLLKKSRADFVYTELPNRDHEFPQEVVHDMFDFFDARRLWGRQGKQLVPPRAPRSSFLEKLTPEEAKSFPIQSAGGGKNEVKLWLADVQKGGGNAEKAAKKIAESGDKSATATLGAWLADRKTAEDVRILCAETIGGLKDAKGLNALAAGLQDDSLKVRKASAEAIGRIGDPKGAAPLAAAVEALGKTFDSKLQGSQMDVVDWETLQDVNATYVVALGALGDAKTAQPVIAVSLRRILLSKVAVDYDRQVQAGPEPSRRAAAARIVPALPGFKEPKLRDELRAIREQFAGQGEILKACEDADSEMSK